MLDSQNDSHPLHPSNLLFVQTNTGYLSSFSPFQSLKPKLPLPKFLPIPHTYNFQTPPLSHPLSILQPSPQYNNPFNYHPSLQNFDVSSSSQTQSKAVEMLKCQFVYKPEVYHRINEAEANFEQAVNNFV